MENPGGHIGVHFVIVSDFGVLFSSMICFFFYPFFWSLVFFFVLVISYEFCFEPFFYSTN